jgi:hypothetical protein
MRFIVDPATDYGLTPFDAAVLEAANARSSAEHVTQRGLAWIAQLSNPGETPAVLITDRDLASRNSSHMSADGSSAFSPR